MLIEAQVVSQGLAPGGVVAAWEDGAGSIQSGTCGVDGLGRAISNGMLFATYCLGKPLLTLTVSALIDRGELSFEDRLGDLMDCSPSIGDLTVEQCLSHQVQFSIEDGIGALLSDRGDYAVRLSWGHADVADVPVYSEFAAWQLVRLSLESAFETSCEDLARALVLKPLGIEASVHLGEARELGPDRIGVNGAMTQPHRFVPLLAERGPWLRWADNPGFGAYMNPTAALSIFVALCRSLDGFGPLSRKTVQRLVTPGPVHYDTILGRDCSFGVGLFTNMRHFGLERQVAADSFGQLGLMGMSGVVVDRQRGRGAAYHLAGYSDAQTMNDWLRPILIESLLI